MDPPDFSRTRDFLPRGKRTATPCDDPFSLAAGTRYARPRRLLASDKTAPKVALIVEMNSAVPSTVRRIDRRFINSLTRSNQKALPPDGFRLKNKWKPSD